MSKLRKCVSPPHRSIYRLWCEEFHLSNIYELLRIPSNQRKITNHKQLLQYKKYCNSLYIGVDKCQQGNYNPKGDKDV